jgi:tRNA A-37 threonylcarbamoyl transferase component Bud32
MLPCRIMRRSLIDGRYVPGDLLGGGGMAQVYLARDEVLGRDVALKILRERYAHDEGFVERFRREAKNAAALNHPSIVQVYDQGSTEDGDHYIAMECVPGGTLAERIKREGPLDPREAAGVASRVAEALSVAHGRGIIHRDIKPQNVLLTASGEAKVADFGIARAASSKTMTETSLILGTASYMSPEQVRGERAGPESDLYSLGVVLYEMLTGEQPYTADNPIATAMKHLDEPPRHPREANPAVPEDLDDLTAKLLAKQPEDRYASAAELAEDLRRVREGLPPLAAQPGQQATAQMPRDTGETRTTPTVVAPGGGPGPAAGSRARRALLPLLALLLGVVLLGGLAWALSSGLLNGSPSGAGGAERVEVPRVVGLSLEEARGRLGDAGLELGSRKEAASNEVADGAVIEQDPPAGNQAERGTAVNVVVSTGPAFEPTTPSPSTATSSASSTATSSATAPASTPPVGGEDAQEAAEEAEKAAEEEAKEQGKAQKESKKQAKEKPPPGGGGGGGGKKGKDE